MNRKTALAAIIIFTLLGSIVVGLQAVEVTKANFYMPPANTVWNIQSPLNSTYSTSNVTLDFTVETNLGLLYFYSLDGQERKEVNTTTLSKVPLPEYPPFIDGSLWNRRTEQAITQLPYLPVGTHNLTIYQIYPLSKDNPQNGNIVSQALIIFNITDNFATESPSPASSPTIALPIVMPSVPEFTLNFVNSSIEVTIKNQPFTPYSVNGTEINLYYQVRFKGHSAGDEAWNVQYGAWSAQSGTANQYPIQSDSEYTVLSLSLYLTNPQSYYSDDKWNIQVQAMIGNVSLVESEFIGGVMYWEFDGKKSDWSNTQTIAFPVSSSIQSPSPTSTVPEFPALAIFALTIVASLTTAILVKRKQLKQSS